MANTTWNPSDKSVGITLSGGNLIATNTNNAVCGVRTSDRQGTGKFYWECTFNVVTGINSAVGIVNQSVALTTAPPSTTTPGISGISKSAGTIYVDGVPQASFGALSNGSLICVAVDCSNRLVWYRLGAAGNWNGSASANPGTGSGGYSIVNLGIGIPLYPAAWVINTNDQITANFGDSAFTGAVPAGFTSGFTTGTPATNELATQIALEEWAIGVPDLRLTQVALEEWATVQTVTPQLVLTQIALEEWASVAVISAAVGGPMITMIGTP